MTLPGARGYALVKRRNIAEVDQLPDLLRALIVLEEHRADALLLKVAVVVAVDEADLAVGQGETDEAAG